MPHLKGGTESFSKVVKRMQNIYHDYPQNAKSLCQKYRQVSQEYQEHKQKSQKSGRGAVVWPFFDEMETLQGLEIHFKTTRYKPKTGLKQLFFTN